MNLSIHAAPWSDEAGVLLAPAMRHDPGVSVLTLARLCERGEGFLYEVRDGAELAGAYLLRVEPKETGHEGVIVAAGGRLPGVSLLHSILPVVENVNLAGCAWARVHTARRGLIREIGKHGYRIREVVLAKELDDGRRLQ